MINNFSFTTDMQNQKKKLNKKRIRACALIAMLDFSPAVSHPILEFSTGGAVGSVELGFGVWDSAVGARVERGIAKLEETRTATTLSVTPAIEWGIGHAVYLGAEVNLMWADDPYWESTGRHSLTALGARTRLSFDVGAGVVGDVYLSTGPALWSASYVGGSTVGWSRCFGVGASYPVTENQSIFTRISYYGVNSQVANVQVGVVPPASRLLDLATIVISLGIRAIP